ncbi:SUR7/PalI family-domain-containing protein [Stachybotrys elegans]|uniref:SUR7/PalI family-domain-containing protein n=1 Tax=Stachybotrys elegans TaxID=80388 RepID=A0A8K0WWQ8_9HYPO|nr:SUR7/PalI family-domain-containing protein [Stachybotrys elegans]
MAGKGRRNVTILADVCYLITIPFLILILIGNTRDAPVLNQTYFFKLDVSQIIPISVTNSNLLNSVARSLGLHDFYQVGLWNFCEGYNDEGITYCSEPETLYWFNPVAILVSELLAGARIALPSEVITVLTLLRIGQQIMFGFFLSGTILNFLLLLATPLVIKTRWWSLAMSLFGVLAAILITVAAIIGTAMSIAFRVAATAQDQLNIRAEIGIRMFVFMWIAAILTDAAFLCHAAMGCCFKPQRNPQQMQEVSSPASGEKRSSVQLPKFMRNRRGGEAPARAD